MSSVDHSVIPLLLCRARSFVCGLPLGDVVETMRPLPVEPLSGAPEFVSGLSIVRGEPLAVVDTACLFGEGGSAPTRFVILRTAGKRVALAFEGVLGVRSVEPALLGSLPPLLRRAAGDAVAAIGTLDDELLLVLNGGRLLPADLLQSLDVPGGAI